MCACFLLVFYVRTVRACECGCVLSLMRYCVGGAAIAGVRVIGLRLHSVETVWVVLVVLVDPAPGNDPHQR